MSTRQRIADRFLITDPDQDLLGRGSMGEVYRATDTHTGEPVAVKALDPRVVARDPGILERFVREGEALRQLDHPNIVRMVAAVEDEGRHYLIMDYVAGGSLQDLLEVTRPDRFSGNLSGLSIPRVLAIALELADALTRAHHLGIIHRDLKPANVLLAEDGTPRLTDFGIARISDSPRLTETGVLVGTPDFLSPEACSGQALDERTDIWAFGVLLFEMLAGETPFPGDSLTAKLTAILTQPVPDLAQRCPEAPEALVDLVYRMLEKDREGRIPSVRLVGAELEAILKGREVPTPVRLAPGESRFSTPTPDAARPRHNLPAQPTPFVGREAELTELARLLADPDVRLLTILGAGGMGKTRLALEAGAAQLDNFQHGVYFVSLAPLESAEAMVPTTAEALGFSFYEGGEPRQQLLDYLREKRKLLIMDNFEHLLADPELGRGDGVGLVADVLQAAPEVKILSTSRARLNVQGEYLFQLAGMDYPEPLPAAEAETPEDAADLEGWADYSAVKLFLQSARRVKPGFELVADDLKYVARICRLVQGMPLGILLAAAWLTMLSPAEIAAEIEASLDFLETDQRDVPERQRSMRAVFDHSWQLLTEREQEVFQALSVFRGGFTREAAQHVSGATLRELRSLVDKSLLRRERMGRYEMHELLCQYVTEKLAALPKTQSEAQDRHCAFYVAFLEHQENDLVSARVAESLTAIKLEIDNVRAAWRWGAIKAMVPELERGLDGLSRFYALVGPFQQGEALVRMAVDHVRVLAERADQAAREARVLLSKLLTEQARFLNAQGMCDQAIAAAQAAVEQATLAGAPYAASHLQWGQGLWRKGNNRAAQSQFESALELAQEAPSRLVRVDVLLSLGNVALVQSDHTRARAYCEQALHISREMEYSQGEIRVLGNLAVISERLSDYVEARECFKQVLQISREMGDRPYESAALNNLGLVSYKLGEFAEAHIYYEQSLQIHRELGDQRGEGLVLDNLGTNSSAQSDMAGAKHYHEQALHIYRELGNRRGESQALVNLGYFFYGLGDYDHARAYCEQARQVHRELGERRGECYALNNLGLACACQGDYAQAKVYLEQSLDIGREVDEPRIVGYILSNLGNALAGLGLLTEAADACRQALVLWRELNQPNLATEPLAGLARIALAQGDLSRAQAHVEEILGHLESGTLHGTEEPARIYMTCYHVLRASQDPRAQGILITAHRLLQERAATIANEEMRRSFLENVPTHREILSEFKKRDQ